MSNSRFLRILLVEESESNTPSCLSQALEKAGYRIDCRRIGTAAEMRAALAGNAWDIVITDSHLSQFSAAGALHTLQASRLDVPFIVVGDSFTDEAAIALMESGAHDCLRKENFMRLPSVIARELTAARHRRESTRAAQPSDRFTALSAGLEDAVWETSVNGLARSWNPAAETVFGYSAKEMVGQPVNRLIPDPVPAKQSESPERPPANDPTGRFTTTRLRKDGVVIDVSILESPLRDERGELTGTMTICRDLTPQRRAEAWRLQLEEYLTHAQRFEMLGSLVSGIAHDLNNHLTGIGGCLELERRKLAKDHARQSFLQQALRTCSDAGELVQRMVRLARRIPSATPAPANLAKLARESIVLAQAGAPNTISFALEIETGATFARVDAGKFQQAVLNLCSNAVHAMGYHAGTVTLAVGPKRLPGQTGDPLLNECAPGPYVAVAVCDQGCGMDAATKARIFEPFFTTKPQGQGTGLGLPTVLKILTEHGGGIEVHSAPGQGSTFELLWPACDEPPTPVSAEAPFILSGENRRILLVDDEPVVVFVASTALRNNGYVVDEFAEPEEALKQFVTTPDAYNLLIIDVGMPEISGFDLLSRIRQIRQNVPVLMMSGDAEPFTAPILDQTSAISRLLKPFSPQELTDKVGWVIASSLQFGLPPNSEPNPGS